MSYKQIDEQFDKLSTTYVGQGGWCCVTDNEEGMSIWPQEYGSVKSFIHLIYDQAKAEQREEDARVAEGMKRTENKHYGCGDCCSACDDDFYNKTCEDIAKSIREAK